MIVFLGQWAEEKLSKKGNAYATHIKHFVLSVGYVMLSIVLYNFLLLLCLTQISVASSPTEVSHYSQLFMAIDQRIFGVYPHLWIQSTVFNAIDYILIQTYCKLAVFFTIVLIGLLLFDKKNFRKFLIAIFISPFLAMPIWYGLPAVTPNEMYRQNIFSLDAILPSQQDYAAIITSDHLKYFFKRLEKHIENPSQNHPLVSTNPSMHVAWAAIITYFAMILWTPLGLVFVPWLLLIMVSTLYTMQHYAIDLPGGLLCAAITLLIPNYLFKFEKKYYTGSYTPLYFVTIVQTDIQALKAWWATKARARSRLNQAVVE
jgi:membrane-associated phospholipid phosphatase